MQIDTIEASIKLKTTTFKLDNNPNERVIDNNKNIVNIEADKNTAILRTNDIFKK